jgi:hypothetical protein
MNPNILYYGDNLEVLRKYIIPNLLTYAILTLHLILNELTTRFTIT